MIDAVVNSFILIGVLFIVGLYMVWWCGERIWDQKNFRLEGETDLVNLSARKAIALLNQNGGIVPVDVRSGGSFTKSHIPKALSLPYRANKMDLLPLESLCRETPLLIYCEGGYHSRCVIDQIQKLGFRTVYHLNRGFKSWLLFGGRTEI